MGYFDNDLYYDSVSGIIKMVIDNIYDEFKCDSNVATLELNGDEFVVHFNNLGYDFFVSQENSLVHISVVYKEMYCIFDEIFCNFYSDTNQVINRLHEMRLSCFEGLLYEADVFIKLLEVLESLFENFSHYSNATTDAIISRDCVVTLPDINTLFTVHLFTTRKSDSTYDMLENYGLYMSVKVERDDTLVFENEYTSWHVFERDMKKRKEDGFDGALWSMKHIRGELVTVMNENFGSSDVTDKSSLDDSDEMPFESAGKFANITVQSIVPDDIQKVRVVSLRFDERLLGIRFKTDKGAFDMDISTASKYGLGGFKTDSVINLEKINGVLMSSTERKLKICVPDISLCEEDCKKLINAMFIN